MERAQKVFANVSDSASGRRAGTLLVHLTGSARKPHQQTCKDYDALPNSIKHDAAQKRKLIEYALSKRGMYLRHCDDAYRKDMYWANIADMDVIKVALTSPV